MEVVTIVQTVYGTVTGAIEYINKIKGNFEQAQELYPRCTELQAVLRQLQERAPKDSDLPSDLYPRLQHLSKTVQKAKDRAEKISNRHFILRSLRASYHEQKLQESVQALESAKTDLIPYIVKILEDLNAKIEEVKVMVGDLGTDQQKGMQHLEEAMERNREAMSMEFNKLALQATHAQKQLLQEMQCWIIKVFSPQGDSSDLSPQALASELDSTYDKYLATQTDGAGTDQASDGPQRSKSLQARFKGVVEAVVRLVQSGEVQQAAERCKEALDAVDDAAPAERKMKEALAVIYEMCVDMADDWEQLMQMYVNPETLLGVPGKDDLNRDGSQVYVVWDASREEEVALKVIDLEAGDKSLNAAKKHLYVMLQAERLGLTNICSIYGHTLLPGTGNDQRFGLVMKRYKASLEKAVLEKDLPLKDTLRYASGILKGLVSLHSVPIVMNDLNPHHVLLDEHGEAVLTDFGMAKKLERYTVGYNTKGVIDGTAAYMAPEQFGNATTGSITVSPKCDMWSFAATVVFMLTGASPFHGLNVLQTMNALTVSRKQPPVPDNSHCPPGLQQLLKQCFDYDPSKRPSARHALEIVSVHDLIARLTSEGVVKQQTAAATLGNLALGNSEQARLIADAGGITTLVSLLRSPSAGVQEAAAQALGKLCSNSNSIKDEVAIRGSQPLRYLKNSSKSTRVQKAAAEALRKLQ